MADPYVSAETLKSSRNLKNTTFADEDVETAVVSASQVIDDLCDRSFVAFDTSNDSATVRYFTPWRRSTCEIDDTIEVESVEVDLWGLGNFSQVWTAETDYNLEPLNAAAQDRPYERIRVTGSILQYVRYFPAGVPRSVKVTAKWGWAATPEAIVDACSLLAARIVKRKREAPLGLQVIGTDFAAMVARSDSDVLMLLKPFIRTPDGVVA